MFKSCLLLTIVAACLVGIYSAKRSAVSKDTVIEFFLYGERLNLGFLVSSLVAANLSLGNLVYVCASLGYYNGFSGIAWVAITIMCLFVGFWVVGPRLKSYIQQRGNFGTIHDFISRSHQTSTSGFVRLKVATALISCVSLLFAAIIELHLGTRLIAPLIEIPQVVMVILVLSLVAYYTTSAGFHSVVFTDIVQCVFLALAMGSAVYFLSSINSPSTLAINAVYAHDIKTIVFGSGWPTSIGLTILGLFWLISTPDTWQRNCSTRSLDTSISGALLSVILLIGAVSTFAYIGMLVKTAVEPNVSDTFSHLLSHGSFPINDIFLLDLNKHRIGILLLPLFAGGLLMAAISTIDTFIIVVAHVMNTDLGMADARLESFADVTPHEDRLLVFRGRIIIGIIIVMVFVAWGIAAKLELLAHPLELFFITYTIQFILGMPVIAGTFKRTQSAAITLLNVVISAVAVVVVGGYTLLVPDGTFQSLSTADMLSLLPVIPVGVGLILYGGLLVVRAFPVHETRKSI